MTRSYHSLRAVAVATAHAQLGVITSQQLEAIGAGPKVRHRLHRTEGWFKVCYGVYSPLVGDLPWVSRASAALLIAGRGAALRGAAALRAHGVIRTESYPIEVMVRRRVRTHLPQVRFSVQTEPMTRYRWRTQWLDDLMGLSHSPQRRGHTSPLFTGWRSREGGWLVKPRWDHLLAVPAERALFEVAARISDSDLLGLIANAVRAGVSPGRIRRFSDKTPSLPARQRVMRFVGEVDEGVESPLELRHDQCMRRHRIPIGTRQHVVRTRDGLIRVDRGYRQFGVRVELDGTFYHRGAKADQDVLRDNEATATRGDLTLRFRWSHLQDRPCQVARQVAIALRRRGWRGEPVPCGPQCALHG